MADLSRWRLPPRKICCQVCEDDILIDLVGCPDCKMIFLCQRHAVPGAFDFHKKACSVFMEKQDELLNEERRCSEQFGMCAATTSFDEWELILADMDSGPRIKVGHNHIKAYVKARQEWVYALLAIDTGISIDHAMCEMLRMYINGQIDLLYILPGFLAAIFQALENGPEVWFAQLFALKHNHYRIRDNISALVRDESFEFPKLSVEELDLTKNYPGNAQRIRALRDYDVLHASPDITKDALDYWPDIWDPPLVPNEPIKSHRRYAPRAWMIYQWMDRPLTYHMLMMQLVLKLKAIADLRAVETVKYACSRLPTELILQIQQETTTEFVSGPGVVPDAIQRGESLNDHIFLLSQDVSALMKELHQVSWINEKLHEHDNIFADFFRYCMSGIAMTRIWDLRTPFFYVLNSIQGAADRIWDEWIKSAWYGPNLERKMTYTWNNLAHTKPDTRTLAHLEVKVTVGRTRRNSLSTPAASLEGTVSTEAKVRFRLRSRHGSFSSILDLGEEENSTPQRYLSGWVDEESMVLGQRDGRFQIDDTFDF